jgi:UDP-glucose 4-epimerase
MHVVVTGGAGFIGSHSVEALLAGGNRVTVFDNFSTGKRENLPDSERLAIISGDVREFAAVRRALEGATHVLHLAAQVSVRVSIEDPPRSCHDNVLGFVNVLEAARRGGVQRVVYASSAAVYGVPARLPLDEDAAVGPISPYGLEKVINDQYAQLYRDLYGQSSLGLRYFNVYGPRQDPASQYAGVISKFAALIAQERPLTVFGDGGQTRDFVFVKDLAHVNALALAGDYRGICNVGTGVSVTLLQLIDALAACAGKQPEVRFEPPVAGDIRESAMTPARLLQVFGAAPATRLVEGLQVLLANASQEIPHDPQARVTA